MSDAGTADGRDDALMLEFEFDAPPAKVWRAVTIPELRERWLPDRDLAGAEPESTIPGEEVRYRLREPVPPHRESQVIFTIEPNADGGTIIRIVQRACSVATKLPQPANSNRCAMSAVA